MSFGDNYLNRQEYFKSDITGNPQEDLNLIVVIPCFYEPRLIRTLESLWNATRPACTLEVIVVVNSPQNASLEIISQNETTLREAAIFIQQHNSPSFLFHILYKPNLPARQAGVGMARKIGMDEAINRFNMINNENGIVVSLDADSTCEVNYFNEIENFYRKYPKANGCNIYFEHPLEGLIHPVEVYANIVQYELHLRYLRQAFRFIGSPYAFHTVGSCFTVKALAYVKQGGMNTRQAGEDFYFLQKIMALGKFYELNSTTVYPSPRVSDRVPFGTGAAIKKLVETSDNTLLTYNFLAFKDLKNFLDRHREFFRVDEAKYRGILGQLPPPVRQFLSDQHFEQAVVEINSNCASLPSFKKKFFQWFNAFRTIKYLNTVHQADYAKVPVLTASNALLSAVYPSRQSETVKDALLLYRDWDRNVNFLP
ncbi:MAG: glycosyltransferase family 2 protein [Bacteroidota bacterium]|nr:glycosyltransferase family 2 protein [Bacteroidota bacterium]